MESNNMESSGSGGGASQPIKSKLNPTSTDQSAVLQALRARIDEIAGSKDAEITSLIRTGNYLQKLLFGVLLSAIFLALGTSLFFVKQMRMVRQQLQAQRTSLDSLRDFNVRVEPEIHRFAAELQTFSGTNPDFRPILEEFQPRLSRYFSTLVPSSEGPYTPAPGSELQTP